jgi:hypothetical protein
MAQGRELKVFLTSDVSKFRKGLKEAETPISRFKKFAGGAMAGVAAAAGAAAVAFGVEGVKAAVADDAAAKKLARTMKNLGKSQDVERAEDYIEALMQQTGIADDDLRPAFEKLIGATGDTDTAMKLLTAATDTAVGSGKDLASTSTAIAKAAGPGGSAGALGKLIPGLDKTAIKGGDANSILAELNKRFSGQAIARTETMAGKWDSMATAFGEVQESFGKGLLSGLSGADDSLGSMDDTLYTLAPSAESLGQSLADIAVSLASVAQYIGPVADGFNRLNDMGDGWLTNGTAVTVMKALTGDISIPGVVTGTGVAGDLSGPDARRFATAQANAAGNYYDGPRLDSFGSSDLYRYNARSRDAAGRGDARGAQKDARTRTRP